MFYISSHISRRQEYIIGKQLSDTTFEGQDESKNIVILKKFQNQYQSEELLRISKVIQTFPSINIVNCLGIWNWNNDMYIVGEKCDYDLNQYIKIREQYELQNDEISNILGQIINGYQHLRRLNILHRCLAPENIFIKQINDKLIVKIGNFSLSKISQSGLAETVAGLPRYIAPETMNRNQYQNYTDQCDIYSLGIILYQLCFGEYPTVANTIRDLENFQASIFRCPFKCPQSKKKRNGILINLIERMIVYKPENRITWDQLSIDPKFDPKLKQIKEYIIDFNKRLGSGVQGVVYEAVNINSESICCAKLIDSSSIEAHREIQIYKEIKETQQTEQNIPKILDILDQGKQTYLFLEKCDCNLEEYYEKNKPLSSAVICQILQEITKGYLFLKSKNIIHRDLKPQNILIKYEDGLPIFKITDFGVGKIIGPISKAETVAGTPIFSAPEVLWEKQYDYQCDVFSLGVMLYYMVFDKQYINPVTMEQLKQQVQQLQQRPFKCSLQNQEYEIFSQLIEKMLIFDPIQRITWEKLNEIVNKIILNQQPITQRISLLSQDVKNSNILYLDSLQLFTSKVEVQLGLYLSQNPSSHLVDELTNLLIYTIFFSQTTLGDIKELISKKHCLIGQNCQFNFDSKQGWDFSQIDGYIQELDQLLYLLENKNGKAKQIIKELVDASSMQRLSCWDIHYHYRKYYITTKHQLKGIQMPVKLSFFLEKLNNIFEDYPLQEVDRIKFAELASKILVDSNCHNYLNNHGFFN